MKRATKDKKLNLRRRQIRQLDSAKLNQAAGGTEIGDDAGIRPTDFCRTNFTCCP